MNNKMENEIWRTYPEFDFIKGSNLGGVKTIDRYVPTGTGNGKRLVKGRVLKQHDNGHGYLCVSFKVNGKMVSRSVHRIVAKAFLPNPDSLPEINHIDNNTLNNCVDNLEWCTHKYNMAYKEKYGVSAAEACGCPVYAVYLKTWEVQWFKTQSEAGRELGTTNQHINDVLKGKCNHTHGYWFTYADSNAIEVTREKLGDTVANKVKALMDKLI